jgi:hypothetical protein
LAEPAAGVASWEQFMHATKNLHDRHIYDRLQTDLIEHTCIFAENQQVIHLIWCNMDYILNFISNYVAVNYLY